MVAENLTPSPATTTFAPLQVMYSDSEEAVIPSSITSPLETKLIAYSPLVAMLEETLPSASYTVTILEQLFHAGIPLTIVQ